MARTVPVRETLLLLGLLAPLAGCGAGAGGADLGTPSALSCVPYARAVSGIRLSGDAPAWWAEAAGRYPRASLPAAGAVLVFRPRAGMDSGHLAVVTGIDGPRAIEVTQANWVRGHIERNQPVIDVSRANDWTAVRVWYPPVRAMGRRIYETYGFILPDAGTPPGGPPGAPPDAPASPPTDARVSLLTGSPR